MEKICKWQEKYTKILIKQILWLDLIGIFFYVGFFFFCVTKLNKQFLHASLRLEIENVNDDLKEEIFALHVKPV